MMWKTCNMSGNKQSSLDLQACGISQLAAFWLICASPGKPDLPAAYANQGFAGATVKLPPEGKARVAPHGWAGTWTSKWIKHQRWDPAFTVMLEKMSKARFRGLLLWVWSTRKIVFLSMAEVYGTITAPECLSTDLCAGDSKKEGFKQAKSSSVTLQHSNHDARSLYTAENPPYQHND